jgi:hypothetical protein
VRAVVRAGPHGPDHQLGHAHADLLSFELSRGAQRLVTDTGTGVYAAGPARAWLRSTAAHNTVQLDGAELLETWSSFRAGRRGRARCHGRGEAGGFAWIHASHDGWRWLPGAPVHHRLLAVRDDAALVVDLVAGGGRHRIESRLHLHPDAPPSALSVHPLAGTLERRSAPYHERFGETRTRAVLVATADAPLPWLGGFWVPFAERAAPRTELALEGRAVRVAIEDAGLWIALRWDVDAAGVVVDVLGSGA